MLRLARDALATRDLRRLQFASLATGIGGWAFMVSLAVHAYAVGGAAAVGLAAFVRMAPAGLAAPLTSLAADRFPRRDVLLAATLVRAALLGAAALAVALDAPFALLLVLATLFTIAATAHKPAQAALLPHLAPSRTRQAASNALWTAIDNGAFVVGAMAGGVLVAALGTSPPSRRPASRSPSPPSSSGASRESGPSRTGSDQPGVREARSGWAASRAGAASSRARPLTRSTACASSRATGGCGCWSASCRPPRSWRAWSTCSWS